MILRHISRVLSFAANDGEVDQVPINNLLTGISGPFSLDFLESNDTRLFLTNPEPNTPGASFLTIASTFEVIGIQNVTIPGQLAACWIAEAPAYDSLFVMDVLEPTVTILDPKDGSVKNQFNFTTPSLGAIDTVVDRNVLYFATSPLNSNLTELIASPQILAYDLNPTLNGGVPKQIQSFDVSNAIGQVPVLQGLALWTPDKSSRN